MLIATCLGFFSSAHPLIQQRLWNLWNMLGEVDTNFQIFVISGQRNMCDYMLDLGLPTAAYDENAVSVIDNIIIKMPTSTAYCALDQFVTTDRLMRQKKYYISCLGKRRFTLLERTKDRFTPNTDSPTALEVIFYSRGSSWVFQWAAKARCCSWFVVNFYTMYGYIHDDCRLLQVKNTTNINICLFVII